MTDSLPPPQITVLDTGGQYCHLIARRIRELGVHSEVRPSDTPSAELAERKGIVISGGPSSVYDEGSPQVDPAIFKLGIPVLGICYGLHLIAFNLDGEVRHADSGEFGLAHLEITDPGDLFAGLESREQIWMSHRDGVGKLPSGFLKMGTTQTCPIAAMGDPERGFYGVQFHPEVVHTTHGTEVLSNFLFRICNAVKDWDPSHQAPALERQIRDIVRDRNVLFFLSGGVDSTVAYTLCIRAIGTGRVHGTYVDTGLMREGETEFVSGVFKSLAASSFEVEDASDSFLASLAGEIDPEKKRHIIGEEFVNVQERILERGDYLDGHWILGQGTIYPDTIESGGTEHADVIKTHHNRVAGIQQLIDDNRIVEPLSSFYKDEVREIGRALGLPEELLERHPFPGPGLGIRCLCSGADLPVEKVEEGWVLPVHSVGVQGDSRSYRPVLALDRYPEPEENLHDLATDLINRIANINRVVALVESHAPLNELKVHQSGLAAARIDRLRKADAIVRRVSHDSGFERKVWQFPVVLLPLGTDERPDSVVLRPIHSVDGMTAQSVLMERELLESLTGEIIGIDGICAVLYDLTHKPPGTIEWE